MDTLLFFKQNIWWILLIAIILIVFLLAWRANFAYDKYLAKLEKYKNISVGFGGNGYDFAQTLSIKFFDGQVCIKTDHKLHGMYSPHDTSVYINPELLKKSSVASCAIIAHEFGHAFQHFNNPQILIKHENLNHFVKALGTINWIAIVLGIIGALIVSTWWILGGIMAVFLSTIIAIVLKFKTIKLEQNASFLALDLLEKMQIFSPKDLTQIKKFLGYAKSTYTADFLCAVLSWTGLVRKTKYF